MSSTAVPTTTTTEVAESGQSSGLKSLLLPAFTDAGANVAFNDAKDGGISEASTAVRDNRTTQQPTDTSNRSPPPPFFASTRPAMETPPPPTQQPERSFSTMALANEELPKNDSSSLELDPNKEQLLLPVALNFSPSRSKLQETIDEHKEQQQQQIVWEEEATPEQTAFGKQLLFQRDLHREEGSEVLSTASEMGTVVDMNRLRELDDHDSPTDDLEMPSLGASTLRPVAEEKKLSEPADHALTSDSTNATTATAMTTTLNEKLNQAIRRIGSGIGNNRGANGSLSAPSTPRIDSASHKSFLSPRRPNDNPDHPSSFLLRSPGSAAFVAASSAQKDRKKKSMLSPRFASRFSRSTNTGFQPSNVVDSRIDEDKEETAQTSSIVTQRGGNTRGTTAMQIARSCFSFDDTTLDDMCEVPLPGPQFHLPMKPINKNVRFPREQTMDPPAIRSSLSWDVASSHVSTSPFRPTPFRQGRIDPALFDSPKPKKHEGNLMTSFSQTPKSAEALELKTPERIEIEREDALDILACLVERGVSLKQQGDEQSVTASEAGSEFSIEHLRSAMMKDQDEQHREALEELFRSHEYAQEMKRASTSAQSWLRSIGRSGNSAARANGVEPVTFKAEGEHQQSAGEDAASEGMTFLTVKALLHSAQLELTEKTEQVERMNEELAQCRAEIGRLKSVAQSTAFRSPNRSILDESDDVSVEPKEEPDDAFDGDASPITGPNESNFLETSFLPEKVASEMPSIEAFRRALEEANNRIRKLHCELISEQGKHKDTDVEEAPIVEVEGDVGISKNGSESELNTGDSLENFVTQWADLSPPLPPPPDHGLRSPIVETILEEWSDSADLHNSLLEWMDFVLEGGDSAAIQPLTLSNLDHQVRDGFVTHILPLLLRRPDIRVDVSTRLQRHTCYDLAVSVEPIAQKKHSPLHLRHHLETTSARSDVGVGSTVNSVATTALVANGNMTTRLVSLPNRASQTTKTGHVSRVSYDEVAETGIGVEANSGLISTFGAFGGLWKRRGGGAIGKGGVGEDGSPSATPFETAQAANATASAAQALFGAGSTSSESDQRQTVVLDEGSNSEQPYHRVVSAPPGRIGVTFVEYRGHAMVSNVADDSPLAEWIFPSDILIAIDEMPVSGKPVRDIIQVLKDRATRRRALRVISTHAMNEFTLNSSVMLVDGPR